MALLKKGNNSGDANISHSRQEGQLISSIISIAGVCQNAAFMPSLVPII